MIADFRLRLLSVADIFIIDTLPCQPLMSCFFPLSRVVIILLPICQRGVDADFSPLMPSVDAYAAAAVIDDDCRLRYFAPTLIFAMLSLIDRHARHH